MKVLHVAETAKGGVGTYIDMVVPLQSALLGGDSVKVIIPSDHRTQVASICPEQLSCFSGAARSARSLTGLVRITARVIAEFKPDLIHAHSTFAGALLRGLYGWRRRRPALVYCPHGWAFNIQGPTYRQNAAAALERRLARLCDRIVAVSLHEAAEAERVGIASAKVSVVRNAIGLKAPEPAAVEWSDRRRKVLFIGRLDRQKGFDLLVSALRGLEDQISVRVAGESVAQKTEALSAANIEILGWLTPSQIEGQLRRADLVVMPSRWEGLPLTALEAMRAGKPVIASTVGGIPEVVIDGVTGRLTPPNDVAALRAALLADDLPTLARMGEQGRRRFLEGFTIDRMHGDLMRLYEEVLFLKRSFARGDVLYPRTDQSPHTPTV